MRIAGMAKHAVSSGEINLRLQRWTYSRESEWLPPLYLIGYAIIIFGLALGAHYMHVPDRWIAVFIIVLVGTGITGFAKRSR